MKSSLYFLERLCQAKAEEIHNDAQLAKFLGVSRQAISKKRTEGGSMQIKTAVIVAEELRLNPMEVICCAMFEQAKTQQDRRFWKERFDLYKSS